MIRLRSRAKPSTAARQTPRAVAKQISRIHQSSDSMDIERILQSMEQNQSVSTQYMGCLALGKLLCTTPHVFPELLGILRDSVIYAMDSHPFSTTIGRAGLSALFALHFSSSTDDIQAPPEFILPSLRVTIDTMSTLTEDASVLSTGAQFIRAFVHYRGFPLAKFAGAAEVLHLALRHPKLVPLAHMQPIAQVMERMEKISLDDFDFEQVEFPIGSERLPSRGEFGVLITEWEDEEERRC